MLWWHWAVLGLALAALEILTPGGFFLLFFGLAGLAVALLSWLGLAGPLWLQLLLFSLASVLSVLYLRHPLLRLMQRRAGPPPRVDRLIGELAIPKDAIAAGEVGKAELRGTTWSARNGSKQILPAGMRCRVKQIDGLVITIEPE